MSPPITKKKHGKINKGKGGNHKNHHKTQKKSLVHNLNEPSDFLNCSPSVKGNTPVSGSCFTADVLEKLKISYNKHHPYHKVESNDPNDIWKELKERMSVCTKEDCWLNVIQSKEERKQMDAFLFAPDQPEEWKKNPNEWLSNFDIMAVLKQYQMKYPEFKLIGPTPIDFDDRPHSMKGKCVWKELCTFDIKDYVTTKKTKLGIVFNLDKHSGPGTHWVSLFVDFDENYLFYMDSAGKKVPKRIHRLVKKIQKQASKWSPSKEMRFYQNYPVEHQKGNTECGMYSLFFLVTMLTGETDTGKLNTLEDKVQFFQGERIPDSYIETFRDIYYNKKTE
jgi:hypothetical protein